MKDSRDFKKEYEAFLQKVPYQTAVVDGVKVRYQYGGRDGAPVILFFNGLEMQEMWMPYAERLRKKYRFLIYEYPFHTAIADEQIDFAAKLLKALSIEKVILIGASDGGVYAQIFAKRHPESVLTMIVTTTLTIDSDYVRDIRKERFSTPILLLLLKLVPAKTELNLLLKKSNGFLEGESEEDRKYGRGFYEVVASDLNYKRRFMHSFKCVYMLKDYPIFKESDFEYLRGKIQVLIPEKDMFKKEDQDRLADLFQKLDAEILSVPGGHVGFIVQSDHYMDLTNRLQRFTIPLPCFRSFRPRRAARSPARTPETISIFLFRTPPSCQN